MADHVLSWARPAAGRSGSRKRSNRGLLAAMALLLLVVLGEAAFHFLVAPNLRIEHINLSCDSPLGREALLRQAGLDGRAYFFSLDPVQVKRDLEAWPPVRAAVVEKIFPDTLRVHVQARVPVALALWGGPDGQRPLAIDELGVVFSEGLPAAGETLPVLSGLRFEGQALGARLPGRLVEFLAGLHELKSSEPALFGYFSEFQIRTRDQGGFDLVGYPAAHRVPVRFAAELDQETLRMAIMVLDVMKKEHILERVAELDFRSGEVVYRLKEE